MLGFLISLYLVTNILLLRWSFTQIDNNEMEFYLYFVISSLLSYFFYILAYGLIEKSKDTRPIAGALLFISLILLKYSTVYFLWLCLVLGILGFLQIMGKVFFPGFKRSFLLSLVSPYTFGILLIVHFFNVISLSVWGVTPLKYLVVIFCLYLAPELPVITIGLKVGKVVFELAYKKVVITLEGLSEKPVLAEDRIIVEIAKALVAKIETHQTQSFRTATLENPMFSSVEFPQFSRLRNYVTQPRLDIRTYRAIQTINANSTVNIDLIRSTYLRDYPMFTPYAKNGVVLAAGLPTVIDVFKITSVLSKDDLVFLTKSSNWSDVYTKMQELLLLKPQILKNASNLELLATVKSQIDSEIARISALQEAKIIRQSFPGLASKYDKSVDYHGLENRLLLDVGRNRGILSPPFYGGRPVIITNLETVENSVRELRQAARILEDVEVSIYGTPFGDDAISVKNGRDGVVDWKGNASVGDTLESRLQHALIRILYEKTEENKFLYIDVDIFHQENTVRNRPFYGLIFESNTRDLTSKELELINQIQCGVKERYNYDLEVCVCFSNQAPETFPWNKK